MDNKEYELFEREFREMVKQMAKSDDVTIEEHNRALKERAELLLTLGYIDRDIYELLCKACDYHDLGKANPCMQARLRSSELRFDSNKEIPHNVLSMYLIPRDMSQEYYILQFAVGFHHDYGDIFEILQSPEKQKLAKELLAEWTCAKLPDRRVTKEIKRCAKQEDIRRQMIWVKGLLHKCDYAASGNTEIEYPNDFLIGKTEQFFSENGYRINEMQKFCLEKRDENIMVVGQTGMGKTEAALLWIGDHKGFIFLPLKTAINKMYDRIRNDILSDENANAIERRLGLLHSDAISKLLENQNKERYDRGIKSEAYQDMDILEYHSRSRQLAMPLTISTVDQLFDFVFQYQTYELKLVTLAYSKIVIDEVQMYGADLLADLIYGLKMIRKLEGKIAITTATLAPFVKDLIEKEVGKFEYGVFCDEAQVRHKVKLIPEYLDTEAVLEKFEQCLLEEEKAYEMKACDALKKENIAGKILVICNTIKKAQWMYNEICELIGEEHRNRVHLLHARFIRRDRARKENEICECGRLEHKETVIWISTSLVEASLDIDFDYLYTELQDIPSLLQRMGRVNRKGKKTVQEYNCFVYTMIEERYLEDSGVNGRRPKDKRAAFIDRDIYNLSRLALEETLEQEAEGVLSEGSKIKMMNYFTTDRLTETNYMWKYREQIRELEEIEWYELDRKDVRIREDIYAKDVIPYDVYEAHKQEIEDGAKKIRSGKVDVLEKIKERNRIMQYTVPVQNYIVDNYLKAIRKKMSARICTPVKIGAWEKITVIDCNYDDDLGFRSKNFDKIADDPIFV